MKNLKILLSRLTCCLRILIITGIIEWMPSLQAQPFSVSGIVKTPEGEPITGVIVSAGALAESSITNESGFFNLPVNSDKVVIDFSKSGFYSRIIRWKNGDDPRFEIIMPPKKRLFEMESLTQKNQVMQDSFYYLPAENPLILVHSKLAGVYVASQSGAPGENPFIAVRGLNSLYYNQEPLIFLDGIPVLESQDLNYFDVESIEVIKNAADASLYGSQGGNGVILLKSKQGHPGKNAVNFNGSFGINSLNRQLSLLNGDQAFKLMKDLNKPLEGTAEDKSIYWGNSGFISDSLIDTTDLKNNNWQDHLFRTGIQSNYSLAFSGGTENSQFRIAGSYFNHEGIINPSDFSRFTILFQLQRKVTRRLDISTRLLYSNSRTTMVNTHSSAEDGGVILSALAYPAFLPVYDSNNEYFINPLRPEINNVDANINGVEDVLNRNTILGNILFTYRIADGLQIKISGASNINLNRQKMFMSTKDVYQGRIVSGKGMFKGSEHVLWITGAQVEYQKTSGNHSFSINGGGKITGTRYSWNRSLQIGYTNDLIKEVDNAYLSESNLHFFRLYSLIGSISYDYKNRYFLRFNMRADASTRFSDEIHVKSDPIKPEVWEIVKDKKWGSSEGFILGWNISEEAFMKDLESIYALTLRASYGITGNDGGLNTGRIYPYYWKTSSYSFNPDEDYTEDLFPVFGYNICNLQKYFWEKTLELDIGLDISLFGDRLSLTVDYFDRTRSGLFLPSSDTTYSNPGKTMTSGLELSTLSLNVSKGDFCWQTGFAFTYLTNTVYKTDESNSIFEIGYDGNSNVIKPGGPVFAFWGLKSDGIFQNQDEVDNHPFQQGAGPGDIRYVDQNSDNIIDENDRVIIGDPNPDLMIGLMNTLRFRNFELSFSFSGVFGQDVLNLTGMQIEGLNDWINQSDKVLMRWTGEESSSDIPRANAGGSNNTLISDRFVEGGSYLRLQNLTLGYIIPESLTGSIGIDHLKIYLTGQNLVTFTRYSGYDPEVSIMGPLNIDYGAYPNSLYVGGGVSIGF